MTADTAPNGLLSDWAIIRLSGADRHAFLQGQLTQDVSRATTATPLPAGWANAKGRLLFSGWLLDFADTLNLLLPDELAAGVAKRLGMYRLRAAVEIEVRRDCVTYTCLDGAEKSTASIWNTEEKTYRFCPGQGALLSITEAAGEMSAGPADNGAGMAAHEWRLWCIRNGIGVVREATAEAFVPQMINLDCIGGISFTKGCYVGQEIVARTHNLGRIKRRMFRLRSPAGSAEPGTTIHAGEQLAGTVVDSVAVDTGLEMLAVLKLDLPRDDLRLGTADGPALTALPLPYAVPELESAD